MSTGFLDAKPRRPGAMIAVIAVHIAGIGGLMMIAPTLIQTIDRPFERYNVDPPIIPPEIVEKAKAKAKAKAKVKTTAPVDQPERAVISKPSEADLALATDPGPLKGSGSGELLSGSIEIDPPNAAVIVAPRFAGRNAQPPYPPGMQRLNIEGVVTVRVLVGVDGRPVQIEAVKVEHEAFFAATRDWGMRKWQFTPATRNGEPFQDWRTMTVRFKMN
jgi:periplasmic protein TonB